MRRVSVVEAKSRLSALLAEVEAGAEIAVTRRGKIVARLVPDRPRGAAEAFRDIWAKGPIAFDAPDDRPAEAIAPRAGFPLSPLS